MLISRLGDIIVLIFPKIDDDVLVLVLVRSYNSI